MATERATGGVMGTGANGGAGGGFGQAVSTGQVVSTGQGASLGKGFGRGLGNGFRRGQDSGFDRAGREHEANLLLFRAVHEVAIRHAGAPFHQVVAALMSSLPGTPHLGPDEIRRIAEEISLGRDPSGL